MTTDEPDVALLGRPLAPVRLVLPALVWAGILALSSIPGSRFEPLGVAGWLSYVAHALEYAVLGAALRWSVDGVRAPSTVTVVVGLVLAAGDEWWQSTVPGRHPSLVDLAVDLAAITVAAVVVGRRLRIGR